eukprot:TRINITY_DN22163_c2_g1_i2.p1 TRINITY_DN22163_c2_g1~~TRINITY_DN22163_c2_g1_i2.p1  ORF type:complete len:910 (+),score=130.54 TRINITY_DN22163_c2_g1_i2:148-2877(+)
MQHSSLLSKHASDSALHKRGAHHSAMPRSVALSSSAMSHRRLPPHLDREGVLPPLHETSMSATSASRRGMSSHSESFYDGRDSKAHVHLGLSTSFSRVAGRVSQAEDARCSEVESLKRQIARLTQLRRDRDTYIQDLLADAEIAEKRHEAEMSRRLARSQREILERLTAQEEEHAQILKERSRSHEAAVAHLVSKHDRQMRELRNSAHTDGGPQRAASIERLHDDDMAKSLSGLKVLERVAALRSPSKKIPYFSDLAAETGGDAPSALARSPLQALQAPSVDMENKAASKEVVSDLRNIPESTVTKARCDALLERLGNRLFHFHYEIWSLTVVRAWSSLVAVETCNSLRKRDAASAATEAVRHLEEERRRQVVLFLQSDLHYLCHVVIRAWQASVLAARAEAVSLREITQLEAVAASKYEALQENSQLQIAQLAHRLQARTTRDIRTGQLHILSKMFSWWLVHTREKRTEGHHKYQLLTAAADASAEAFRLRNEAHSVTTELRRQRRAHGVAAINASLDRRLQGVMHAWAATVRETQNESMFQRQLDMAAAESAASCAVLRMEWRRSAVMLREQRQAHGLRRIAASVKHVKHTAFFAWRVIVNDAQQELHSLIRLRAASAEAAAARAEVRRKMSEVYRWQRFHCSAVSCLESTYWTRLVLSVWRRKTECEMHVNCVREASLRVGNALTSARHSCFGSSRLAFASWRRWTLAQRNEALIAEEQAGSERQVEALCSAMRAAETAHENALSAQEERAEKKLRETVLAERRFSDEALARCEAQAREAAIAESVQHSRCIEELEARQRKSLCEQAAELEAKHAVLARQHADATKALVENIEARFADELRAETVQLALVRAAEEASARDAAALHAKHLETEAELHAQSSAFEVRLAEVEARHAVELRTQAATLRA